MASNVDKVFKFLTPNKIIQLVDEVHVISKSWCDELQIENIVRPTKSGGWSYKDDGR